MPLRSFGLGVSDSLSALPIGESVCSTPSAAFHDSDESELSYKPEANSSSPWRAECPRCIALWSFDNLRHSSSFRGQPSLLVEKLTREFGCRLARLEDFFFRLIFELWVLVRGKVIFSRNDAELF